LRRIRRVVSGTLLAIALVPTAAPAQASPEATVVREINRVRLWHGLGPLKRSPSLHHSSSRYARWLMSRNLFGHRARIAVASRFEWAGENLELHWGRAAEASATVRRWMHSSEHREVILSGEWRWIGVGRSIGSFSGSEATIWVAHFGRV
jgi:uncharacterized protein YkwD